jgi:hypothetical protein
MSEMRSKDRKKLSSLPVNIRGKIYLEYVRAEAPPVKLTKEKYETCRWFSIRAIC